ncbi:structure-specific endonuclease subunit SLX4 isoform X2 [Bicyclus anynana]|uniref:Structure-specific endonuclease subunit SLX4 n=1 Tax=Bicyclus anynana TaxID=110368 RepID=A0ABM3M1A2_BICAN|nr:structure-specific endonuclease subunit SLX4 isoform X2 [Bicyclus anynana]
MPNKVVSKYFATDPVMDDSLSDFQEKKKYNIGPKNVKKTRGIKKSKHIRGQRDIRKLIKKQENEVLTYSEDFDKVCKQIGVDVDSEELQLAVALSKSLHEVNNEIGPETEIKTTESSSSQQRLQSIKTTLQEYGFKLEGKITTLKSCSKKLKKQKRRSLYKLLQTTDNERQQIISDKYSEILARNIFKSPVKVVENEFEFNDRELYYKTTNIVYERIKNDDVYYLNDLFEKPPNRTCCLRDWSEIPGRPLSPTIQTNNINFDDLMFDQHDLDCILSGSIHTAQHIVSNKKTNISYNTNSMDKNILLCFDKPQSLGNEAGLVDKKASGGKLVGESDCSTKLDTMSDLQLRCVSPDLFDDEVSTVLECMDNDVQVSGQIVSMTDNINTYSMDLTECVNIDYDETKSLGKIKPYTNDIDITNRRSNDFMEITNCLSNTLKQSNMEKIDLTQTTNDLIKQTDNDDRVFSQNKNIEFMDLTQVPDYKTPSEKMCNKEEDNLHEDTIILVNEEFDLKCHQPNENLTVKQGKPICTDTRTKGKSDQYNCYSYRTKAENCCSRPCKSDGTVNLVHELNFKETSTSNKSGVISITEKSKECTFSNRLRDQAYDSLSENYCEYEDVSDKVIIDKSSEYKNKPDNFQLEEIDLTQSSNSFEGDEINNQPISRYSLTLGKRDNVSIDYDDIIKENYSNTTLSECRQHQNHSEENDPNMDNNILSNCVKSSKVFEFSNKHNYSLDQSKHDNSDLKIVTALNDENGCIENEANISNNDIASNPSNSSEVFEISDKELNYSLHQSKHDNFDFRDVTVMNDFLNGQNNTICKGAVQTHMKNTTLNESNLVTQNRSRTFGKVTQPHSSSDTSTPIKSLNENLKNVLQTPKNSDYIIKTTEVTPMLDYASMTSPERHKELEKYGLKPFKRKRAIQLLTYLYNQTHPIVESNTGDCPSPSKRLKMDDKYQQNSTVKLSSPSKKLKKVDKDQNGTNKPILEPSPEINNENYLYAVTNEHPDIRNIECDTEEWIFQKREKAKLHSCRVPLHIAFQNYVTCRRRLREAILRYEPVNIDVIYKDMVATGYRYNPKDLLKFMDRKCITVRTADNNARNRKS